MILLSQAAPAAGQWPGFWTVASFLAFFAANLATVAIFVVSTRKQRREINLAFEPASKVEFDKHVAEDREEHDAMFSKIGGVERAQLARMDAISTEWRQFVHNQLSDLIKANNDGREKLHNRINEILSEVSEMRGELKTRNRN